MLAHCSNCMLVCIAVERRYRFQPDSESSKMSKIRSNERLRKNSNSPSSQVGQRLSTPPTDTHNSSADQSANGGSGRDLPFSSNKDGAGAGRNKASGYRVLVAAIAVVALGLGAYFATGTSGDVISDEETQTRFTQYQSFIAGSPLPVKFVSAQEMDQAIDSMPDSVSTEQKQELRTQIDSGQVRLAWLSLWDTHAEDGDILRFESSGSFPIDVMALNKKTTIAIPFPADGNVLVTGVKDGGGGITIALESGATQIQWPTMKPNDQLNLPVTPGF